MPLNDFYTYRIESQSAGNIKARISINAGHPLFKGHFPAQPVTPGVVLVEIIRKVLSQTFNKEFMLTAAKDIKFIAAVIPTETTELELSIDYERSSAGLNANCIFSGNGQIFTKLRGEFSE